MIAVADLPESVLAIERRRLDAGEPVAAVRLAGLQFHAFGSDDGLGGTVSPRRGDRLQLVREPDNPTHAMAVGVWWRNEHRIGHLPWMVASPFAPDIDAGESVRAYLVDEGDGTPWSAVLLLIGKPVREIGGEEMAA